MEFKQAAHRDRFVDRHIGPSAEDVASMLEHIGIDSLDALIDKTIPAAIRGDKALDIGAAMSEPELLEYARRTAAKNDLFTSHIGMGYYDTVTPPVILRNILENPGWYTQYTPYQAEIAQGRLEALINFQTMVVDLTGLEIANASLLDEATAVAEAMAMMFAGRTRVKANATRLFVSNDIYPQTRALLETRCEPIGVELVFGDYKTVEFDGSYFGAILQYPADDGNIADYRSFCTRAREHHIYIAAACDLMSLLLLTPPGEFGADIAVGSTQRFGVPMGYGGPHAAFFATREKFKRLIPGRIIGVSVDAQGGQAYRMALQTREQHIRRERATSNICTAQVLLAVIAGAYAVYHGPRGLRAIAERIHRLTVALADGLKAQGHAVLNQAFFDTISVRPADGVDAAAVRREAEAAQVNLRYFGDGRIGISLDETCNEKSVERLLRIFLAARGGNGVDFDIAALVEGAQSGIPAELQRTSEYMTHPVFSLYHSETEMLRYLKRLENKDLSLTHSMIALGSCTMKLNATTEMIPVTWREFGGLHPFAPLTQSLGYRQIFTELERDLAAITEFAAVSLQPNSGAQGEYAGLMTIRAYHKDRDAAHRNIVLIPSSAHGTNPASGVMAGMKVVVVKCDALGNIDVDDLRAKAEKHSEKLAALMVTYPSTHGVFEESIREICDTVHRYGGLVYMDGANMNAQVGLTSPARIGADVCHLNLHKTFCIPHGGGGPGMGPICVNEKLAPYLPGHPLVDTGGDKAISPIAAAPWGSASILLISWAYIKMMGGAGLTDATRVAILNANYILKRLDGAYKPLYTGANGTVAHEMILDTREFKQSAGIEVEDIAKRLIDYGYHAPTVSFPVPGTMMIEPTESESLAEIDRFCDVLLSIRREIAAIESGEADREENVLKHAPHTLALVTADNWDRPYPRSAAAWPIEWLHERKFWASVARVNNTYGDRNLVCSCPPLEEYQDSDEAEPAEAL